MEDVHPPKKIKIALMPGKGRGVIATSRIEPGEVVERCPILVLRDGDVAFLEHQSDTLKYYYLEQTLFNRSCVMFGYASLYNHSTEPNAELDYSDDPHDHTVFIYALRAIEPGEEVVWNYDAAAAQQEFLPLTYLPS